MSESPQRILAHAKICLETLIQLYYLRHSFNHYNPMMVHFLSILNSISINKLKLSGDSSEEAAVIQSSVILATQGFRDQGRHCYLARTISRAVFNSVDLVRAHFPDNDSALEESEADDPLVLQHVRSTFPVGIVSIADDIEKKRLVIQGVTGGEFDGNE
ncbi:MAG: hypothetical protein M1822_000484 [Bathelium mastoideum]|nr:MAG: hypothetical protein M1822_000484 [Bathelium mastoideum]